MKKYQSLTIDNLLKLKEKDSIPVLVTGVPRGVIFERLVSEGSSSIYAHLHAYLEQNYQLIRLDFPSKIDNIADLASLINASNESGKSLMVEGLYNPKERAIYVEYVNFNGFKQIVSPSYSETE